MTEQEVINTTQLYLDAQAQLWGYDSILSASSYAAYPNEFWEEGTQFLIWRSDVWAYLWEEKAKIDAGTRPGYPVDEAELLVELTEKVPFPMVR